MPKKIAILQSNYIPWKGYFDLINQVDEFILFDQVQYTKNDWRNRNLIKTSTDRQWLTIPVKQLNSAEQKICDTEIAQHNWHKKHWQSLLTNYAKAPFFKDFRELFADLYLGCNETHLSQINYRFIIAINAILGITTKISRSSDYAMVEGKTERLVSLCRITHADEYLSGPSAKNYLNESLFNEANIRVSWMDYSGYPEYPQLHPPFQHQVSILDLIFNTGPDAPKFMRSFNCGSL